MSKTFLVDGIRGFVHTILAQNKELIKKCSTSRFGFSKIVFVNGLEMYDVKQWLSDEFAKESPDYTALNKQVGFFNDLMSCNYNPYNSPTTEGIIGMCRSVDKKQLRCPDITPTLDMQLRKGYFGGIQYENIEYKLKPTLAYSRDLNSAYPFIALNYKMPYDSPTAFVGTPDFKQLFIARCLIKLKLKEGKISCLFDNNNEDIKPVVWTSYNLQISSYDWQALQISYDIAYVRWYDGYYFKSAVGKLAKFILPLYNLRDKSDNLKKIGKLILNSSLGLFGQHTGKSTKKLTENGLVTEYRKSRQNNVRYIPYAIFLTSAQRYRMIEEHEHHTSPLIYSNTDSFIYAGTEPENLVNSNKIGEWKTDFTGTFTLYGINRYVKEDKIVYSGYHQTEPIQLDNYKLPKFLETKRLFVTRKGVEWQNLNLEVTI
jgi:hypothetical protein